MRENPAKGSSLVFISKYLASMKPCGNLMLSRGIVSALNELSISYILNPGDSMIFTSYSIFDHLKVNLICLLSWLLRLNHFRSCSYWLVNVSRKHHSDIYLYDGYDSLLTAFLTPRKNNYLIASDLYSRASFQSLFLGHQSLALRAHRILFYLRAIIIENIMYRYFFNKVFFVSSLDESLYNHHWSRILPCNGTILPFTLDQFAGPQAPLPQKQPCENVIRVLFTGNFDQISHIDHLLDCLNHLPIYSDSLSITVQSFSLSDKLIAVLNINYPHVKVIGKVHNLDEYYSGFDFIVFTNKQTTGIQTKYLHSFRVGTVVLAPHSTALDFGHDLIHNKNIILYNSFVDVYPLIINTYYASDTFNSIRHEAVKFYNDHHSFQHTLEFIRQIFLYS